MAKRPLQAGVHIRKGHRGDLETCLHLLSLFYGEERIDTTGEQMTPPLSRLLDGDGGAVFLAEQTGKVMGIAVAALATGIEQGGLLAELSDLYVLREFRGQGVGAALTQFAIAWARENDCQRIQLLVTPKGQATRHLMDFYKKHAFQNTGRTVLSLRL